MASSIETRNLLGSALAVLLTGAAFFAMFRSMDRSSAAVADRFQVNLALQALEQALSNLTDAETGQRGYLLTGQKAYLVPYERGKIEAAQSLDTFLTQGAALGLAPHDLDDLRSRSVLKLDELRRTVNLAQEGHREEALAVVEGGEGHRSMEEIRLLRDRMRQMLLARRATSESVIHDARTSTRRALFGFGGLALLCLGYSLWALHRDIRLRTAAEKALAASEAKFKALADHAPVGIFEMDLDAHRPYINGTLCELAGLSYEEGMREGFRHRIHPEDLERVLSHWSQVRASGTPSLLEYRYILPDGRVRWVESRAAAVPGQDGQATSFVGIVVDQTERREASEALLAANQELESFAYSVSHDLRAPLRHIDGFVALLRKSLGESADSRASHHLEVISGAARQMGALIDDLLSFSRMGRAEVRKTDLDLGALVRRVVDDLGPDAAGRDIEWRIGELPRVHADPALLRLALLNLVGNALKFTRGRSPARIEISAASLGAAVAITIRDNGAGFDMRHADKLFGVFQRLHRQDEFEGTGIGLANVARIIHKHGGQVAAEGAPGEGAAFTFTLPMEAP